MVANTPISKSTFTHPQFQAFYVTFMPYLDPPGSSFFKRANAGKFLKKFENMCNDYQMAAFEKICHLPLYCEMFTACHVICNQFFRARLDQDWYKSYERI